jgi:hypothetical protein
MKRPILLAGLVLLVPAASLFACSYCDPSFAQRQPLTADARQARFVVFGSLSNPRLDGERGGFTDLTIEGVVKTDAYLTDRRSITIGRYIPVDAKKPPRFLVFCDIVNGRLDTYRGVPVKSDAVVGYLKGAMAIPEKERVKALLYYYQHLDSVDADVASDAFLEFAKAADQDVGEAARHLRPEKLRKLLNDPNTPSERLGLFAFLLGACGNPADVELLSGMLAKNDDRTSAALSGLLGGLIELRPQEGWSTALAILRDSKRSFSHRLAVVSTLRFYHGWKPVETRQQVLRGLAVVVEDGNMADMAIEDLRRWQWWDHTKLVLAQYGKDSHAAPLVQRAIIRYALCCPDPAAAAFVKARRSVDPETVTEVEEGLEFEKPLPSPAAPVTNARP